MRSVLWAVYKLIASVLASPSDAELRAIQERVLEENVDNLGR